VKLELERVSAGYGQTEVLHDVSLHVGAGEAVAIIGANGAGKTTLLRWTSHSCAPTSSSTKAWCTARKAAPSCAACRCWRTLSSAPIA
jgi:ABC-type branched-subunit amino acid transport system ATPase component